MTTESERLRRKIEFVLPVLRDAERAIMEHPDPRRLYPEYLWAMYWIVCASVPLMERAAARATVRRGTDPVAAGLVDYLEVHIPEEQDHDEWLLEDIEHLGVDRSRILNRLPSPTIASLVGAQYYWIDHCDPVALMGYIAVLEGNAPTRAAIDRLSARTGYPPEGFRTLEEHGALDPHHLEEFNGALDALPLSPERSALVGANALTTVLAIARLFDQIARGPRVAPNDAR